MSLEPPGWDAAQEADDNGNDNDDCQGIVLQQQDDDNVVVVEEDEEEEEDLPPDIPDSAIAEEDVIANLEKPSRYGSLTEKRKRMDAVVAAKDEILALFGPDNDDDNGDDNDDDETHNSIRFSMKEVIETVAGLKTRADKQTTNKVYCTMGRLLLWCIKSNNNNNNNNRDDDTSMMSSSNDMTSILKGPTEDEKASIQEIANHYIAAFEERKKQIQADLMDLEYKPLPAEEQERRYGENTSSIFTTTNNNGDPFANNNNNNHLPKQCLFCNHEFVDQPKSNDDHAANNAKVRDEHFKLYNYVTNELTNSAVVMVHGRTYKQAPPNPSVKNKLLKPVIARCHCHQMKRSDGTCLRCCNQSMGEEGESSGNNNTDCEICRCNCAKAWLIEDNPTAGTSGSTTTTTTGSRLLQGTSLMSRPHKKLKREPIIIVPIQPPVYNPPQPGGYTYAGATNPTTIHHGSPNAAAAAAPMMMNYNNNGSSGKTTTTTTTTDSGLRQLADVLARATDMLEDVYATIHKRGALQTKDNQQKLRASIDAIVKNASIFLPTPTEKRASSSSSASKNSSSPPGTTPGASSSSSKKRPRDEDAADKKETPEERKTKAARAAALNKLPPPANGMIYSPLETYTLLKNMDKERKEWTIEGLIQEKKVLVTSKSAIQRLLKKDEPEINAWWFDFAPKSIKEKTGGVPIEAVKLPVPENGLIFTPIEACRILRSPSTTQQERNKLIDSWIAKQDILVKSSKLMRDLLSIDQSLIPMWWNNMAKPHFLNKDDLIKVVQTQLVVQHGESWGREELRAVLKAFKEYGIQATGIVPEQIKISDESVKFFMVFLGKEENCFATTKTLPRPANGRMYSPREAYKVLKDPSLSTATRAKIIDEWIRTKKIPVLKRETVLAVLRKKEEDLRAWWTAPCNVEKNEFIRVARAQLGGRGWGKEDVIRILTQLMQRDAMANGDPVGGSVVVTRYAIEKYTSVLESDPVMSLTQIKEKAGRPSKSN